ncbi:MAG: hypothetical protein ISS36_01485 [Candidatus Aenigmarchaeota archaeon]|nr:hypothetical protein [Candidatus Aenigmarchaeota archaeon]
MNTTKKLYEDGIERLLGAQVNKRELAKIVRIELKKRFNISVKAETVRRAFRRRGRTRKYIIRILDDMVRDQDERLIPVYTGLISRDALPDLEDCIKVLHFRSYRAIACAVAEETGIPLDTVINSIGKKKSYGYIRREIVQYLKDWLDLAKSGGKPDIDSKYTGVRTSIIKSMMRLLIENGEYPTNIAVCRYVAKKHGLRAETIYEKYFLCKGDYAPLDVYEELKERTKGVKLYDMTLGGYMKGDKIYHHVFGVGVVKSIRPQSIDAEFDGDMKKLAINYEI